MLGVNAATLRQWTTNGKVHVYRTPGGHRRFSAAELVSLSHAREAVPQQDVVESVIAQLRARYRGLAQSSTAHQGWLANIDDATRQQFHGLGDELLGCLGDYLLAGSARQKQQALTRGRDVARRYGTLIRDLGVDTSSTVEAYTLFRRPLLDVLARTLSAHPQMGDQVGRTMRDAMDDVLIGLAAGAQA
jgi:DNA-binding transcriptional MerR regulator